MYSVAGLGLACLIVLHTPDGHHHFTVRAEAIHGMEPAGHLQDHLARHTNTIILIDGRHRGVRETEEQVISLRKECISSTVPK